MTHSLVDLYLFHINLKKYSFFLLFFFIIVFILLNHKDWQDKIEITKFLHTMNSDSQDKKKKKNKGRRIKSEHPKENTKINHQHQNQNITSLQEHKPKLSQILQPSSRMNTNTRSKLLFPLLTIPQENQPIHQIPITTPHIFSS